MREIRDMSEPPVSASPAFCSCVFCEIRSDSSSISASAKSLGLHAVDRAVSSQQYSLSIRMFLESHQVIG